MRERRYAPLGATTALDARVTALEGGGVSYLPLTAGSGEALTGALWVEAGGGESMVIKDDVAGGNSYNAWIQWKDSGDVDQAYIGFGSASNEDFYINNQAGGPVRLVGTATVSDAYISAQGSASDQGQAGQIAFVDVAGGFARFGSYNWDTAAYQPMQLAGSSIKADATITVNNAAPKYAWYESDQGADGKLWDAVAESGILRFRSRTDADGNGTDWLQVTRSGNTVTNVEFGGNSTMGINVNTYVDLDDTSSTCGIRLRTAGTQRGYLYADVNGIGILNDGGAWAIKNNHADDSVDLYISTTVAMSTQNPATAGISSGISLRHPNAVYYDAGFNQMPRTITNASATLSNEDAGGCFYSNNATTYTITLNNQTDFPVEACFFILNYGSGNVTIAQGTGSLLWPNGSANSGNRTVGPYSVATIFHYSAGTWFIWGDSIS